MKMMFTLVSIACLIGSVFGQASYNYSQNGRDWEGECASGMMQSPINIDTNSLTVLNNAEPLKYFNYNLDTPVRVEISRFTVEVTPITKYYKLSISGGGLPGIYNLDHVHFHWPAEHTVDEERSIMEAHYVHLKDEYRTIEDAVRDPQGIAVLAVLYKRGLLNNYELFKIRTAAHSTTSLIFERMLPNFNSKFYRYNGSLTTPDCDESVIWTVYKNSQHTTDSQVDQFRKLLAPEDQAALTYRDTQDLNGRCVELWSPSFWG